MGFVHKRVPHNDPSAKISIQGHPSACDEHWGVYSFQAVFEQEPPNEWVNVVSDVSDMRINGQMAASSCAGPSSPFGTIIGWRHNGPYLQQTMTMLPSHTMMRITFEFAVKGSWDPDDTAVCRLDQEIVWSLIGRVVHRLGAFTDLCGAPGSDHPRIFMKSVVVDHFSSNAQIEFS